MRAPTSTVELLDLVRKSGICAQQQLDAKLKTFPSLPVDPSQSAAMLVQQGMLTRFQAKLLLTGRYRGFKLGPYVVREQIGQGGMGAVYLAEHETLQRRVALKVLPPTLKKDTAAKLNVERFLREARSVAALDHPNIVRIHDVGQHGEIHYLVMEYVEGQSLEDILKKSGPMPASRAVEYIAQAAAGLQHAHEKKFIHRDIKPANLMLSKDGTVKILDMGLARSATNDSDKLTERMDEGAIVGTADFISPEQALNQPNIDIRSDIYSLGATFFALVTGTPPFAGNTTQKLMQHQMKDAPSLTAIDRTFPPELAKVVTKMLQKKPEHRFQSPGEVIQAVANWLPNAGAQRMVVSLSGTDLAHSVEMQNTLSEIASGGTQRISKSKRLASLKGEKPWKLYAGIGGGVVAVIAIAAFFLSGGTPTEDKKPVTYSNPVPPVVRPPVTQPPEPTPVTEGPKVVHRFEAANLKPFRWLTRNGGENEGEYPKLPAGWRVEAYQKGCTGEFKTMDIDGRRVFAIGHKEGTKVCTQLVYSSDKFPQAFEAGHAYEIRVEYKSDPELKSKMFSQKVQGNWDGLKSTELNSNGWATAFNRFTAPADRAVQVTFGPNASAPGKYLYIHRVEVTDLGVGALPPEPKVEKQPEPRVEKAPEPVAEKLGEVVVSVDFSKVEPTVYTYEDGKASLDLSKVLPPGVWAHCWMAASIAEFRLGDRNGKSAISVTNRNDALSSQLQFNLSEIANGKIEGGKRYRLTVEYLTMNDANGQVFVRRPKDNFQSFAHADVVSTNGEWKTLTIDFTAPTGTPTDMVMENKTVGEGNSISVAKVEVVELK